MPKQQNLQDFHGEQGVALLNLRHKAKSKVLLNEGSQEECFRTGVDENVLAKSDYRLKAKGHTMFGRTARWCLSMVGKNAVMD